jgi:single-strand DNA-binding protein
MYQQITIIGRLGHDPDLRYTPQGTPVCNFSVATDYIYNNANGERQQRTTWFRVVVFGKMAENCNAYLAKGRLVLVTGRVSMNTWTDRDGNARASLDVHADTVRFLSPKSSRENGEDVAQPEPEDEERPF